jgi:KaiC/GvpD/RAD55 family RecA-like ATPase
MGFLENIQKREMENLLDKHLTKVKPYNKKFIKKEIKKHINNTKKHHVNSNTHHLSIDTGKIQIERPHIKKKNSHEHLSRTPTGIPGLDEVMEKGFRSGTVNLIGGGAGSGKSIFCMQYLVNGIDQYNQNGVYISFEESKEKIMSDFKKFNWNLEQKVKNGKLEILYFTPEQVNKVIEAGGGVVRDLIDEMDAKRLVIDSLTAFTLLFQDDLEKRKGVLNLFETLHKWNITALVTSEAEPDPNKHESTIMEFEVDGVILLYNLRKGNIRERSLEIFKMRGTDHSAKIFPMIINLQGVKIYPDEEVF